MSLFSTEDFVYQCILCLYFLLCSDHDPSRLSTFSRTDYLTFYGTEGEEEGEGVGGFSSKQTYNYTYTKVLLKKLMLAEDF